MFIDSAKQFDSPKHLDSLKRLDSLKNLDSPKYLDHSFERLVRNSRASSPFHRELTTALREPYSSAIRDTYKSRSRDCLAIRDQYTSKSRDNLTIHEPFTSRSRDNLSARDRYTSKSRDNLMIREPYASRSRDNLTNHDRYSSRSRDNLSIRDTYSSRNRLPLQLNELSYRSKSYHGDLSRIPSTASLLRPNYYDDIRGRDLYRSERSLSRSVTNLPNVNSTSNLRNAFNSSYVNAYSRHHSHHNHQTQAPISIPSQINRRDRFRARNAYKAYRSRSANRSVDGLETTPRSQRSSTSVTAATYRADSHYSSHDSIATSARISKSLSDIRTIQSRLNHELTQLALPRDNSTSYRSIDRYVDHDAAIHILNPDIYVRWLKNKWDAEESMRRQRSVISMRSTRTADDYSYGVGNRLRGSSYPSRTRYSYESSRVPPIPTFTRGIRGKQE